MNKIIVYLVIAGSYNQFEYWCRDNRFYRIEGKWIKYTIETDYGGNVSVRYIAKYASLCSDMRCCHPHENLSIILTGTFHENPLFKDYNLLKYVSLRRTFPEPCQEEVELKTRLIRV